MASLTPDTAKNQSDQRRAKRFKSYSVLKAFGPHGREVQTDESALVNISEGGLMFYAAESVEKDATIKIHIEIPEFNSSITVAGKAMWVQPATEKVNCYFVGVQFVELEEAHRGLIRKLGDKQD